MTYRCPSCGRTDLADDFCLDCVRQAEPLDPGTSAEQVASVPPPVPPASPPDRGTDPLRWPSPPEPPRPQAPERAAVDDFDTSTVLLGGQRQVEQDLEDGYEMFLLAGVAGTGKTQFIDALEQLAGGFLRDIARDASGRTHATTPNTIIPRYVQAAGRKLAILDAPGELFKNLFPYNGSIRKEALAIPKLLAPNLRGVILVIDLEKLWGPPDPQRPEWREQVDITAWILEVLRWLIHDGQPPRDATMKLHTYVDRQVRAMTRKQHIHVPVLVLFTKADLLNGLRIPGGSRNLWPVGENPLLFAYHALSPLHRALLQHADHFRYDFVHSLVEDKDTGVPQQFPPCGVRLAMDWLLDESWRSRRRGIPTRRWLAWQQRLDRVTGHGERWRKLPEPRRLER